MVHNQHSSEIEVAVFEDFKIADKFVLKVIALQLLLVSTFGGYFYDTYLLGIISGAFLFFISFLSYRLFLGTPYLRIINAIVFMSFSVILIQQSLGRIEMHFHIFIMLSFLLVYKDVKPILAASLFIIVHHLLFTYLQLHQVNFFDTPLIIFNYGCGYDIAILHAFFVVLEMAVLVRLAMVNRKKMYEEIEDKCEIITLNETLKKNEAEIKAINRDLEVRIEVATEKNREQDKLIIKHSREAQEQLSKSVERFGKHVISSTTDLKGRITDATESFAKISGYSVSELIGRPHNIVRHPEELKETYKEMWSVIKSGKEWRGELKNIKKNGEPYWVDVSINPLFDEDGKICAYESVRHDITSQKIKEEFMANMSHELRTPLNSIIGFSAMLNKKLTLPEEKKLSQQIKSSANFLLALINDILDLSKIQDSNFTISPYEFNAYNEMYAFSQQFESLTTKKILLFNNRLSDNLKGVFFGDYSRINQIILNLISNAVKFTPDNGEITFSAEYIDGNLLMVVEDTGIGMNKKTQDRIFKPFVQADGTTTRKYGGTGLGLSITQGLVDIMKGRIELESQVNVGTVIRVSLPLKKLDHSEIITVEEEEEYTIEPLNAHVLVVEDNKTNQMLIEMLLEDFAVSCDMANNGLEALSMYSPDKHALVLMDENMPNMNGIEAMKILKEKYKERCTPIVALTANAMKGDREKFVNAGMSGYVAKPIDHDELYRILKTLLDKQTHK